MGTHKANNEPQKQDPRAEEAKTGSGLEASGREKAVMGICSARALWLLGPADWIGETEGRETKKMAAAGVLVVWKSEEK